jgi:hypothetical protein
MVSENKLTYLKDQALAVDLPEKITVRTPLYFGDMLTEIERGFGCSRAQAAELIDEGRRLGFISHNPQDFTLQIIDIDNGKRS